MSAPEGRVLRFTRPPLRAVVDAERVKVRLRFGVGSGLWRLALACGHTTMPLKLVRNIQEAEAPTQVPCWTCLAPGAAPPAS